MEPEISSNKTDLPPLSREDFEVFNHMAVTMEYFHNHFRDSWQSLTASTSPTTTSHPMSARQIVSAGLAFVSQLTMHHDIEEARIFPILARRMPGFNEGGFAKEQHKLIHQGLDNLGDYLLECKSGERELKRIEVWQIMDSFGKVLWTHLDEEVKTLGAENMRLFWSKTEMEELPM